jgi:hypothetical protein
MFRFAIMVLPALLSLSLWSQQGSGSMCNLTIHVRMTDDRQDAANVQVQLPNTGGPFVGSATTHADGTAEFQVSSGVTYRVRVSGRGVEAAESRDLARTGWGNADLSNRRTNSECNVYPFIKHCARTVLCVPRG